MFLLSTRGTYAMFLAAGQLPIAHVYQSSQMVGCPIFACEVSPSSMSYIGSRILGLGDLGANGLPISIAKLSVSSNLAYTLTSHQ